MSPFREACLAAGDGEFELVGDPRTGAVQFTRVARIFPLVLPNLSVAPAPDPPPPAAAP